MNRIALKSGLLLLAFLAVPAAAAERGTGIERNETRTQIEKRFLEKQKVCDSYQGTLRETCLAEARAAREKERAAADKGHAETAAKRDAREAAGTDPRKALEKAGEDELAVQRKIAMERCDKEPREKRESCREVARARYGK